MKKLLFKYQLLVSGRNLRKAMLLAEVCHVKGVTDGPPPEYDWEIYLKETARKIIEQQTPSQVLLVRSRLYELLVRLIPPNIIFQVRNHFSLYLTV